MSARRFHPVDSRGRQTPQAAGEAVSGSESPAGSRIHNSTPLRRASLMQEPVLVLNATYEPINVTAVRRAMVLLLKGVAQAEEMHSSEVHSAAHAHRVPSVIRLLAYRHIPQQTRALSRKNILLRDRNTCQFCGRIFPEIGTDAGPRRAAIEGRGGRRGRIWWRAATTALITQQGRPDAGRGGFQIGTAAAAVHAAHVAAAHATYRTPRRAVAEVFVLLRVFSSLSGAGKFHKISKIGESLAAAAIRAV